MILFTFALVLLFSVSKTSTQIGNRELVLFDNPQLPALLTPSVTCFPYKASRTKPGVTMAYIIMAHDLETILGSWELVKELYDLTITF